MAGVYEYGNELSRCRKCGEFLGWLLTCKLLKDYPLHVDSYNEKHLRLTQLELVHSEVHPHAVL
jgi:hypothetical protein